MDNVTLNLILKTFGGNFVDNIRAAKSSFDAWTLLEQRCLGDKETQLLDALAKLQKIQAKSVDDYVRQFKTQVAIIRCLDTTYPDRHFLHSFLATLPAPAAPYVIHLRPLHGGLFGNSISLDQALTTLRLAIPRRLYFKQLRHGNGQVMVFSHQLM